jgi:hypothetical protein
MNLLKLIRRWGGSFGLDMPLLTRGYAFPGKDCVCPQWHCGSHGWFTQNERCHGGGVGSQRCQTSVAVIEPPSSIRPELTGIALALEACPNEENLTIPTDCLSAMRLLQSTQRRDFPPWLHRHPVRHLLKHVVNLLNARSASGSVIRFIKVRARISQ